MGFTVQRRCCRLLCERIWPASTLFITSLSVAKDLRITCKCFLDLISEITSSDCPPVPDNRRETWGPRPRCCPALNQAYIGKKNVTNHKFSHKSVLSDQLCDSSNTDAPSFKMGLSLNTQIVSCSFVTSSWYRLNVEMWRTITERLWSKDTHSHHLWSLTKQNNENEISECSVPCLCWARRKFRPHFNTPNALMANIPLCSGQHASELDTGFTHTHTHREQMSVCVWIIQQSLFSKRTVFQSCDQSGSAECSLTNYSIHVRV